MSSRARILAAVTLLIGCLASPAALTQVQNLEAGKSPSQLFAGTCNACHKSPRGLLKTVSPGSLPGFLREHYTTSGDMASQLATYLISNGAGDKSKQGADKPGQGGNDQADRQGRKSRNAPSQEAARPEDVPPPGDAGRQGRKRQARPGEAPEEGRPVVNAPSQADTERGPDGRRLSAKQRSRIGKPPGAEEPSIANEPPKAGPAREESGTDDKAKGESRQETGNASARPDAETKPAELAKPEPAKPEAARIEAPKDGASGDKPNAVPAVTSAAPAAVPAPAPAAAPAATSTTMSGGSSEPAPPRAPAAASDPSGVTASAPPPAPTGPPAPPISQ